MHNDLEAAWALSCIPWYGWRMPILKAISDAGTKYLDGGIPDHILDAVNESMLNINVDIFRPQTEQNKDNLLKFVSEFVSKDDIATIENFFNDAIKSEYSRESCTNAAEENRGEHQYAEKPISNRTKHLYFHCSLLLKVLKSLSQHIENEKYYIGFVSYFACMRIAMAQLHAPTIYYDRRIGIDDTNATVPLFDFWSYQYLQRNKRYLRMLSKFSGYIGASPNWEVVPRYDLFEYFYLEQVDIAKGSRNAAQLETYNALVAECIRKFGYNPTWPIYGYTSDMILPRMISGTFRVHERETPLRISYCDDTIFACSHEPMNCRRSLNVNRKSQTDVSDMLICDPKCLEKISRVESARLRRIVHKSRPKIRNEGLRRMLGLWVWDFLQIHKEKSVPNAIQAVTAAHFPEENPNWKPNGHNESKDGETWASYRERLLDERQLYHDYQEACRCVEAGEFLAKRTN
jgi:hypothetical protein